MSDAPRPTPTALALQSFEVQAKACRALGSPFYAALCDRLRVALDTSSALRALADGFVGEPVRGNFAIRLLGGVHARVLAGNAPEIARHFPSVGGDGDATAAADEIAALLARDPRWPEPWLAAFPQTNEVRRSAALLPGLLEIAHTTELPLRLLEIGSSAGLNLQWDRFHYDYGMHTWGDATSPVRLVTQWRGRGGPPWQARIAVASRAGCDIAPIDPCDDDAARRLQAYVWPDQLDRLANLRAAIAFARETPPSVVCARAADWLAHELAQSVEGVVTVVCHSIMWAYVPQDERARIARTIEAAGERASARAPLAWLSLEDASPVTALWLRRWPDAPAPRALAHADPHVTWIMWMGKPSAA